MRETIGSFIKANKAYSQTRVIIASLSVILLQFKLTKLKLEILKSTSFAGERLILVHH